MVWSEFRSRWLRQRDRLLMSAGFQRWAARFPLTRFVARLRARQTFDLVSGFVYTQVLLACVQCRLFDHLAAGPVATERLAELTDLPPQGLRTLLRAGCALRLVEHRGAGCYGLGALGAPLLANPGLLALIRHNALLYADMRDPLQLLREGGGDTELGRYWAYATAAEPAALETDTVARYSDLMALSQAAVAAEVIDSYDFSEHAALLDVGGGDGAFCAAVAGRWPRLTFTVAHLPILPRALIRSLPPKWVCRLQIMWLQKQDLALIWEQKNFLISSAGMPEFRQRRWCWWRPSERSNITVVNC